MQVLGDVLNTLLKRHLPPRRIPRSDVRLVPNNMQHRVRVKVVAQLGQPALHVEKRGGVGDVVAEQRRVCAAVVQLGDAAEALLPGRVPDLQADGCVWVVRAGEALCKERGADGRGDGAGGGEGVMAEAREEGCLADALGADDDDFGWRGC